jgi:hypothetical protein
MRRALPPPPYIFMAWCLIGLHDVVLNEAQVQLHFHLLTFLCPCFRRSRTLYSSHSFHFLLPFGFTVRIVKWKRIRDEEHLAHIGETRNAYKILVREPHAKHTSVVINFTVTSPTPRALSLRLGYLEKPREEMCSADSKGLKNADWFGCRHVTFGALRRNSDPPSCLKFII